MILLCDGAHETKENMARDRALFARAESGREPFEAVMRLFRFEPAGITLGAAQDPARELDLERCRAAGVDWAVRPTGGRAIFHAEEWTYSITARIDDPRWGGTAGETYRRIGVLLADSLAVLGVSCQLARGAQPAVAPRSRLGPAPPCFSTATRLELLKDGRKLAGSAQRRGARAYLQQGSLLLSSGHLRLADFLRIPESDREATRAALAAAATHAGAEIAAGTPLERWAEALEVAAYGRIQRVDGAGLEALTA